MTILAWLAVSSLVWGAVIWSVGRVLQRSGDVSGRARQWIWRGATVLLVAPWIAAPLVAALGWGLAPHEAVTTAAATTLATLPVDQFTGEMVLDFTGAPAPAAIALDLTQMLLMLLAGGWIVRFVLAQYAAKSLLGIVAVSRPAEKGAATVALAAWTKRLGLRRAPRLRIVNEAVSPFSFGVFRPMICLPEGLEDKLSREALNLVIGHECLHVARGDGWRRPLERIAADVMWFNPAAWLIRRELDVARELACDEGMVELSSARQAYARTLRDVAGFSAGLSHAAPAASMSLAGGGSLMLRVKRTLASAKRKPARSAVVAAILTGLLGAPIAMAQVVFVVPAPPAPPAPPVPPAFDAQLAELPAPPVPPLPPAAAAIDADGSVRTAFAGKIAAITGGKQTGFSVRLEHDDEASPCVTEFKGLVSINVAKGDKVAEGALIGKYGKDRDTRLNLICTDGEQHSLAMPPAPPAAPALPVELAELAGPPQSKPHPRPNANPNLNLNPSPNPSPAPRAQPAPTLPAPPAPMATPLTPAPPAPMAPQATPLSPAPPVPMAPQVAPLSPVAPMAPVTPITTGMILPMDTERVVDVKVFATTAG